MNSLQNPPQDQVTRYFATEVRNRLGSHVKEIRLFGSRARGDADKDSDYDMLVVVDEKTADIRSTILDVEVELMDLYGTLVTSIVQSEATWKNNQRFPLALNIAREGLSL
jgi:predicted nucleotidyltransferase